MIMKELKGDPIWMGVEGSTGYTRGGIGIRIPLKRVRGNPCRFKPGRVYIILQILKVRKE
jgi:hypothetical protein